MMELIAGSGGLAVPTFVVVYRLTPNEMPKKDIVSVPIPGLTIGCDWNIYNFKNGYVVFVRGKFECDSEEVRKNDNDELDNDQVNDDVLTLNSPEK